MSDATQVSHRDFEIRGARAQDVTALAETHLAAWLHAYCGIVDDAWLSSLTAAQFEEYHRPRLSATGADPAEPFIVVVPTNGMTRREQDDPVGSKPSKRGSGADESPILGFARAGPTRAQSPTGDPLPGEVASEFSAELYAIYIHPRCQGHGIGRALFERIVSELIDRGHQAMCVWVLTENTQARRFYERAGGAIVAESMITLGGRGYRQVAYGWERLHVRRELAS